MEVSKKNIRILIMSCLFSFFTILQVIYKTFFINNNRDLSVKVAYLRIYILIFILLLSVKVILKSAKSIVAFLTLVLLSIVMLNYQSYSELVFSLLLLFCVPILKIDKLIKIDFFTRLFTSISVILFSKYLGTINIFDTNFNTIRYSLGFYNPNTCSLMLFTLALECIVLYGKRKKLFSITILFSCMYIFLRFTKSRTEFFLLIFVIIMQFFLNDKVDFFDKHISLKLFSSLLPIIFCFFSVLVPLLYMKNTTNFFVNLNNFFSNRLYLSGRYLTSFHINYFGRLFDTTNLLGWGSLDNGYVNMLVRFGIIPSIVFLIMYSISIWNCASKYNQKYLIILLVYTLVGVSETGIYISNFNIGIYLFYLVVYNNLREARGEKSNEKQES